MARRKTKTAIQTIRVPRAAGPQIIKVQAPRAPAKRKAPRRRRRQSTIGAFGGAASRSNIDVAIGGGLYGLAVKAGLIDKLPAIPIVGRTGTAAILLTYASQRGMGGELVKRMAIAASVLAGYQLGTEGKVLGDGGAPMHTMGDLQTMGAGRYMVEEIDGDDGDDDDDDDGIDGDDFDDGEPVDN
jgi:hypothetical protein